MSDVMQIPVPRPRQRQVDYNQYLQLVERVAELEKKLDNLKPAKAAKNDPDK